LVLNPEIDYDNYANINNIKDRNRLLEIIEERNVIDTYRRFHSNTRKYTWRKKNPSKQARLDCFFYF